MRALAKRVMPGRVVGRTHATLTRVLIASITILGSLAVGCHGDSRMSVASFVEMQQRLQSAGIERAKQEVTVKVDDLLGPYKVGPSDVLSVNITGLDQPELFPPVQVRVDRNGDVELPTVGMVKVAGQELEDVEDTIRSKYVPAVVRDAAVHVQLASSEPTNVLVVGAVTVPGFVQLLSNERNMLYALVAAGGVSQIASGKATLRRVRRPAEQVTLDLFDPVDLRAALSLDPLERGDIIQVQAARPNTVYVGGLVNAGSPQTYPPGAHMTVLQALAAAGGLRTDISPKEGTLTRRMNDGTDVHVKLNLDEIACGEETNLVLAAGDILWVPYTFGTRVQDFINRNVFLRAGVSVNYNVTGIEYLNRQDQQSANLGGGNLEDSFDPFGFITRNQALQNLGG